MPEQRKSADDLSVSKKKVRQCLESYLDFGFIEGQDSGRPECFFSGKKLANDSMKPTKLKRHQETKHPDTVGESRDCFSEKEDAGTVKKIHGHWKGF